MINRISGLTVSAESGQKLLPDYSDGSARLPGSTWTVGWRERIESYVGEHPVLSLTIGLTVGIVVGCLMKRR